MTNTGLGVYTITQAYATGNLSGSNSKVYDGSVITPGQLNSNGDIKVSLNFPGVNGQTYTLQQNDYTISGNATDADDYTINLTTTGVTNVENYIKSLAGTGQNNQSNVKFTDNAISGTASFTITASKNVVSVGDTQTETYKGSPYSVVYDANGNNSVKVSIAKAAGNNAGALAKLTNVHLDSGDFKIVSGNATDVGQYQIGLTDDGLAKIQQALGKNYEVSVDPKAHGMLDIKPVSVSVKIGGSAGRDYNGNATSVADVTNQVRWSSTGFVTGENLNHVSVTASDYTWYTKNADGTYTAMTGNPVNAGTYYLKLNDGAIAQIKRDNPNYSFEDNTFTGEFTYTINAAAGTAKLRGHADKTYDGNNISTADLNSGDIQLTVTYKDDQNTVATVGTYRLRDGDYTIEKAASNTASPLLMLFSVVENPNTSNVGIYVVRLSEQGLQRLQAIVDNQTGNGNVILNASGIADFVISPAEATVTVKGNQTSTVPIIDDGQFSLDVPTGVTIPSSLHYQFVGAPTESGVYNVELTPDSLTALKKANHNYKLKIKTSATFTLDATLTITFQDADNGNQQVGEAITKTGVADSTISLGLSIPAGYKLADGTLPTTYTFGTPLKQTMVIQLAHDKKTVNPAHPGQPGKPGSPTIPGENGGSTGVNGDNIAAVHGGANATQPTSKRLPQTGNHDSSQAVSLGLFGTSLATMFGLAALKKRKEEK